LIQPILALGLSALLLGEHVSWPFFVTALVVLVSMAICIRSSIPVVSMTRPKEPLVEVGIDHPFVVDAEHTKAAESRLATDLLKRLQSTVLPQSGLQDRTGVPHDCVSEIEAGQIDMSIDAIVALAVAIAFR